MIYEKTVAQEEQHRRFIELLSEVQRSLSPYSGFIDTDEIHRLKVNFEKKLTDFFSAERKFNIAVIGQVKSGKSSFINALLFKGDQILPQARTPKTCVLTMVEHSSEQQLCVEFYDVFEWTELKKLARLSIDTTQVHAARDIMSMAQNSEVSMNACFEEQIRRIDIIDRGELNAILEDYVGERGRYTPFVKAVTLKMDLPELENISLVDTPGLNDPVPSRRVMTQQFLEHCDAAFFLSPAAYFLDSNDIALVSSQLPQKGTKRLLLIASQFDNALMDTLKEGEDIECAEQRLKRSLEDRAKKCVGLMAKNLASFDCSKQIIEVVNQCQQPYFVSVVAHHMSLSLKKNYNELEKLVDAHLSRHVKLTKKKLAQISGFDTVTSVFDDMVKRKQELLINKAASFAVVASSELKQLLHKKSDEISGEITRINTEVLPQYEQKNNTIKKKIVSVRSAVDEVFEECYGQIEQSAYDRFVETYNRRKKLKPGIKTEVEVVHIDIDVNDSVWYNPLTWNKKHKEYITQQKRIQYADTKDVLQELTFAEQNVREQYAELREELMSFNTLQQRLQNALLPIAGRDIDELNDMIEVSLKRINMPQLMFDFKDLKNRLQEQFDGKINDESRAHELINYSDELMKNSLDLISAKLQKNIGAFETSLRRANEQLCTLILKPDYELQSQYSREFESDKRSLFLRTEAVETISKFI